MIFPLVWMENENIGRCFFYLLKTTQSVWEDFIYSTVPHATLVTHNLALKPVGSNNTLHTSLLRSEYTLRGRHVVCRLEFYSDSSTQRDLMPLVEEFWWSNVKEFEAHHVLLTSHHMSQQLSPKIIKLCSMWLNLGDTGII